VSIVLAICALFTHACPAGFSGNDYQAGTASTKARSLWSQMNANTKPGKWHSVRTFVEVGITHRSRMPVTRSRNRARLASDTAVRSSSTALEALPQSR